MNYNPLVERYELFEKNISDVMDKENKKSRQITWYDRFNVDEEFTELNSVIRDVGRLKLELEEVLTDLAEQTICVKSLGQAASLGWDPRYWFSSERLAKQSQLNNQRKAVALLTRNRDDLEKKIETKDKRIVGQQTELENYRNFDRLEADATVNALKSHLVQLTIELDHLRIEKERIDEQLREPLAALMDAKWNKDRVEREIGLAMDFDRRLNCAPNSYERRMVHDECSATFNEGSPARVVSARRREAESLGRTVGKLDERVQSIVDRATRVVKTLVIDGNNLCYQYQTFIGLSALMAVGQKLSRDYPVVIVFDAAIRQQLQMRDQDIALKFGDVIKVHVVASKQKADETLLDAARDPDTYVISNDRFRDFPDKAAVREQRLIRHEILNGIVFVHDLSVAEEWA